MNSDYLGAGVQNHFVAAVNFLHLNLLCRRAITIVKEHRGAGRLGRGPEIEASARTMVSQECGCILCQ